MASYPELYVDFFHHFNVTEDYFECHEVLEELWLERGREPFYQGLLQVAVGLYHHRGDNLGGARKLFTTALTKLSFYPEPVREGIALEELKQKAEAYLQGLLEQGAAFPFLPFRIALVDPELAQLVKAKESK